MAEDLMESAFLLLDMMWVEKVDHCTLYFIYQLSYSQCQWAMKVCNAGLAFASVWYNHSPETFSAECLCNTDCIICKNKRKLKLDNLCSERLNRSSQFGVEQRFLLKCLKYYGLIAFHCSQFILHQYVFCHLYSLQLV